MSDGRHKRSNFGALQFQPDPDLFRGAGRRDETAAAPAGAARTSSPGAQATLLGLGMKIRRSVSMGYQNYKSGGDINSGPSCIGPDGFPIKAPPTPAPAAAQPRPRADACKRGRDDDDEEAPEMLFAEDEPAAEGDEYPTSSQESVEMNARNHAALRQLLKARHSQSTHTVDPFLAMELSEPEWLRPPASDAAMHDG